MFLQTGGAVVALSAVQMFIGLPLATAAATWATPDGSGLTDASANRTFYVNSAAGTDFNPGTFKKPFATLQYALSGCSGDNNTIIVLPGHTETLSDTLTITQPGTAIMGVASDDNRPVFVFDESPTAPMIKFAETANNCCVQNCEFRGSRAFLTDTAA